MIRSFISALLFSTAVSLTAAPQGPIGETANYVLDKNVDRTSRIVASGTAISAVNSFLPEHPYGPSYFATIDFDVMIKLHGREKGSTKWIVPEDFFTPKFMEDLRTNGIFESPDYKMKYEGRGDATTLDGTVYPGCDKVFIYDVKLPENSGLRRMIAAAAGAAADDIESAAAGVENLQIHTFMYPGVPALHAVKLDLSAKSQGTNIKFGFDFKKP